LPRPARLADNSATASRGAVGWTGKEIATMVLCRSLVPGLATTPYASLHFHRRDAVMCARQCLAAMRGARRWWMPAGGWGLVAIAFGFGRRFWRPGLLDRWMHRGLDAMGRGCRSRSAAGGIWDRACLAASVGIILARVVGTPAWVRRRRRLGLLAVAWGWPGRSRTSWFRVTVTMAVSVAKERRLHLIGLPRMGSLKEWDGRRLSRRSASHRCFASRWPLVRRRRVADGRWPTERCWRLRAGLTRSPRLRAGRRFFFFLVGSTGGRHRLHVRRRDRQDRVRKSVDPSPCGAPLTENCG